MRKKQNFEKDSGKPSSYLRQLNTSLAQSKLTSNAVLAFALHAVLKENQMDVNVATNKLRSTYEELLQGLQAEIDTDSDIDVDMNEFVRVSLEEKAEEEVAWKQRARKTFQRLVKVPVWSEEGVVMAEHEMINSLNIDSVQLRVPVVMCSRAVVTEQQLEDARKMTEQEPLILKELDCNGTKETL